MTADELRAFLGERGVGFDEKEVQNGHQFRCHSGEVFVA
jgi:ribonuclease HI